MSKRYNIIVGIDEAGRGPLAGPVIACAITGPAISNFKFLISKSRRRTSSLQGRQIPNPKFQILRSPFTLRDSKKLSPKQRQEVYHILKKDLAVEWGIGNVSEKVIDEINIFEATKLAMGRAVNNLTKKLEKQSVKRNLTPSLYSCDRKNRETPNFKPGLLLIDGNFGINIDIPQKSIIKGDEKVFLIKLASIVAKVHRDRIMLKYHKKYPQYGFDRHKGYGTKLHFEMLKKYGPCGIHRLSFNPVAEMKN